MSFDLVDEFFEEGDFAVDAVHTSSAGVATKISVIFNDEFTPSQVGQAVYQNVAPSVLVKAADLPDPQVDETLKIGSITYKIIGVQEDSTGLMYLELSKD